MKIDVDLEELGTGSAFFRIKIETNMAKFSDCFAIHFDQIEDLEMNLTDIIKQLQDYRMKHNHGQ